MTFLKIFVEKTKKDRLENNQEVKYNKIYFNFEVLLSHVTHSPDKVLIGYFIDSH